MRSLRDSVVVALIWRYACHSAMLGLSLLTEGRPAPSLPDTVLDRLPRVAWIADHNYWIWLLCYVPAALLLWRRDRPAFLHFLYLGGVLSLVRGLCVGLTGLGPAYGPDVNAGMSDLFSAWLTLINPFSTLFGNAAQVYLTKDLFFSGPRLDHLPPLALLPGEGEAGDPGRRGALGDGGGGAAVAPALHDRRGGGVGGDVQPVCCGATMARAEGEFNAMSPKAITAVLGTLFLFPSFALATDPPETILVQRLLEIPQLKEEIIASCRQPAGPWHGFRDCHGPFQKR